MPNNVTFIPNADKFCATLDAPPGLKIIFL